jgi:hypothetical protein
MVENHNIKSVKNRNKNKVKIASSTHITLRKVKDVIYKKIL